MQNLLTKQEQRRYDFVRILSHANDWIVLPDLAKELDCSSRVLKDDIQYINEHYHLVIYTSTHGVRLEYDANKGFKTFCQKMLGYSSTYKVLEMIFVHPNQTVQELADRLFISPSTLYRLIDQINHQTIDFYNFHIETNPCQVVGDEEKIRYFFYVYFFEKYPHLEWAFDAKEIDKMNHLIEQFSMETQIPVDFAYSNVFKVIITVNSIRYQAGHYVKLNDKNGVLKDLLSSQDCILQLCQILNHGKPIDSIDTCLEQVFAQYYQSGFYDTEERFLQAAEEDADLSKVFHFTKDSLVKLSLKHQIDLPNIEEVLYLLFGTAYLEYREPQSGYILYNRNKYFANEISNEFPHFYEDLYEIMKTFRGMIGKPVTDDGIVFYVYTIFIWWRNLVPELRRKMEKIRVLIISDRHKTHASMLKDFLEYEFSEQLVIEFYDETVFSLDQIKKRDYDLIISTFTIEDLGNLRRVYISNVPKFKHYLEIKNHIDDITMERMIQMNQ